jgi:hypothetical protein
MQWELLIIPLIAVGVWILGTLFKTGEEDSTKKGARPASKGSGRTPGRRPVTDLDRFLEEARRRREAEEKRKVPAEPPPQPTISRPPLSDRPSRPRERVRPAPPVLRVEEVPVAIPVARLASEPAAPRVQPSNEPAPIAPTTTRDTRPSPIAQQVRSLLSQPRTAGTAFVLREIFDRPRCMRRR